MKFLLVLSIVFSAATGAAARGRLKVGPDLMKALERVLDVGQDLHAGLTEEKSDRVEIHLAQINNAIEGVFKLSAEAGANRPHLIKIVEQLQRSLSQAQVFQDPKKKSEEFKNAFSQLVLIARSYKLTKKYRIYFCSKDKAQWIQKRGKIRNPVRSKSSPCGMVVEY